MKMISDNALGLAAVVAAVLSIGGALALAHPQPPAGDTSSSSGRAAPAASAGSSKPGGGGNRSNNVPAGGMRGGMMMGSMGGPPGMMPGMGGMPVDDAPEMTELAHIEDALSYEAEEIVGRYAESEDAAERKTIAAELKDTLTKQFDVQRQRRELELGR